MDYDNLDFVYPKEKGVASINEEEREEETQPKRAGGNSGRRGPDVERDRDVNCHQHHDDADDVDNDGGVGGH